MATVVSLLAATAFWQSLVLVIVSATATGIFGILIVIIQTHSEKAIHARLDQLERQTQNQTRTIVAKVEEKGGTEA